MRIDWLDVNEADIHLAAYRHWKQQGGSRGAIFREEFAPAGRGRVFRDVLVVQRQYWLNFQQLRDAEVR